ncbi:VC0807 family protein [Amycolatopsis anabasis]|uniref:VC0807 family protein n=1 Tax=Amycolatopsis anabasis TaxID=1840409 RepID=UPI00131B0EF4|nr:VC0807 family protein [Amycolatopsis anabasis]
MTQSTEAKRGNTFARTMISTLFLDIGLSVIAYYVAELLGASTYVSLLAGTVVAGVRTIWVAVAQRRVDPLSLAFMLLFGAGLGLSFLSGDPRLLLAKESATTFVAGAILAGSCLIRRPLAYYAARRMAHSAGGNQRSEFEATAQGAAMRRRWYRVSLVWGGGLLADSVLRVVAVYALPLGVAANFSQALMIVAFTALIGWTLLTRHQAKPAA